MCLSSFLKIRVKILGKQKLFESMKPTKALAIMALPTIASQLIIPILILMNAIWGLTGLIWAQLAADALNALIACLIFSRVNRSITGR